MQVYVEMTSGLQRRLMVGVPAERVEREVNSRLQKTAKNARINGFRPGKIPMKVIRQRFEPAVRQEVQGEVMSQSFYEAVNQENLRPAGEPKIEARSLAPGKDLEYVATFEVLPEIEPVAMTGFKVSRPLAQVTGADVDEVIEMFRRQQGSWQPVERAAASGDQVNIDYEGTRDGAGFDGGSGAEQELVLGSGSMLPGFEEGLVGLCAGQEKTLALNFPESYHKAELKGAAVQFKVTLHRVSERLLAPLDKELFGKYGVTEGGAAEFRREVEANMQRELAAAIKNRVRQQLLAAVLEAHASQELPQTLIDREVNEMRQNMLQQYGAADGSPGDVEQLLPVELFRAQAERRVRLGLVLREMLAREKITLDPALLRRRIEEIAATYQEPEQVVRWYYSNEKQRSGIEAEVLEEQLLEKLLDRATVSDEACSYQQAITRAREQQAL